MKKTENNSYLFAFYKSAYFIPFFLFVILSFTNNILFFQKNFIDYDWRYYFAIWGGLSHDLFFFSLTILILAYICKFLPIFKTFSLIILYLFLFLPVFDYFYFKATLERFNWVVLQFINFHSAKGYIGNMGISFFYLIMALIVLAFCFWLSFKKDKFAEHYSTRFVGAIVIFFFFSSLFSTNNSFPVKTNFYGHVKVVEGKNQILKKLSIGSIYGFFANINLNKKDKQFQEYKDEEKVFLEKNGFLPTYSAKKNEAVFDRVIMVVLESFALEYIHALNSDIPKEASPYFDYLINNYPHLNNFYTSDFPSLQGFNVILSSKIPFNESSRIKQWYNLASLLESKYPDSTWFLRGSSRVYGNEDIAVKNIFGFSHLIGYEDLSKKYREPNGFVWGYNDYFLYEEASNILSNESKDKVFMVIKLLNQHQPVFSEIYRNLDLPDNVKKHPNDIVRAIYDADKLIKSFIEGCEKNHIINDRTLVIITADHYPPLGYGHTELIKSDYHFQLGKLPLIVYTKQKEVFKNLDKDMLCCQLDIAPTLCELLGFDIPKEYMGQSLLSENFIPRSIGILNNERVFFQSEKLTFSESLINPATETVVIRKWINNLWSEPDATQ